MGGLASCGVIYHPVYRPSEQALRFNDDERFPYDLRIVDLTFASAMEANARWPYTPRSLADALDGSGAAAQTGYSAASSFGWSRATSQSAADALPRDPAEPYRIGPGDVLIVNNAAALEAAGLGQPTGIDAQNAYQVSENGDIFVPELGFLQVAGETLESTRRTVQSRMEEVFVAPIAVVNIQEFRSKSYSVTGASIAPYIEPVTTQAESLREAVIKAAARSPIYDEAVIELVRDGRTYRASFNDIVYGGLGAETIMRDDDQIRVLDNSGASARSAQLDQTIQSVELDRSRLDLQNRQLELQTLQNEIARQRIELDQQADARARRQLDIAQSQLALQQRQLDLDLEAQRRAEQQLDIQRRAEQRQREQLDLQRQAEQRQREQLDIQRQAEQRQRAQFDLQRQAEQRQREQLDLQRRQDQRAAESQELARRADARSAEDQELRRREAALREQQYGLSERADARAQENLELDRLQTRERLGGLARDYVYVGGEVMQQARMPMPYGQNLSLADALMESRGLNTREGDPSGINVVRVDARQGSRPMVYIFALDGRNVANMSVATTFQMRPNDMIYVTPQPVTNWSRVLTQLLPSLSGIISTGIAASTN